jgi:hypothetical protein
MNAEKFDGLLEPALDLAVDDFRGQVDERDREPRQEGLEAQPLVQASDQWGDLPRQRAAVHGMLAHW